MLEETCESENYRATTTRNVHINGGEEGRVLCCRNHGCNWNVTTARADMNVSDFISGPIPPGSGSSGDMPIDWVPILIVGAIVLTIFFCCCCFLCIWCANKRNDGDDQQRAPFVKSGRSSTWSFGRRSNFDVASEKSVRGTRRINVAPSGVTVMDARDHERYSAIDRKLYNRRSGVRLAKNKHIIVK